MKRKFLSILLIFCAVTGFTIPASAASGAVFSDISKDAWYSEAVEFCLETGLMNGTSDTLFSPDAPMTRGMLATVLYRQAGSPPQEEENLGYPFADVPGNSWYADGIYWARLQGVINGYTDDRFGPDDPVTREQLVTILWRSSGSPQPEGILTFSDRDSISSYAADAVAWAQENGIINGREGGRFDPEDSSTRAEIAAVLFRFISTPGTAA